jgi:hypothetical protein
MPGYYSGAAAQRCPTTVPRPRRVGRKEVPIIAAAGVGGRDRAGLQPGACAWPGLLCLPKQLLPLTRLALQLQGNRSANLQRALELLPRYGVQVGAPPARQPRQPALSIAPPPPRARSRPWPAAADPGPPHQPTHRLPAAAGGAHLAALRDLGPVRGGPTGLPERGAAVPHRPHAPAAAVQPQAHREGRWQEPAGGRLLLLLLLLPLLLGCAGVPADRLAGRPRPGPWRAPWRHGGRRGRALRLAQSQRWGPRPLDLDIVFYGSSSVDHESLQIPHIRCERRRPALAWGRGSRRCAACDAGRGQGKAGREGWRAARVCCCVWCNGTPAKAEVRPARRSPKVARAGVCAGACGGPHRRAAPRRQPPAGDLVGGAAAAAGAGAVAAVGRRAAGRWPACVAWAACTRRPAAAAAAAAVAAAAACNPSQPPAVVL